MVGHETTAVTAEAQIADAGVHDSGTAVLTKPGEQPSTE